MLFKVPTAFFRIVGALGRITVRVELKLVRCFVRGFADEIQLVLKPVPAGFFIIPGEEALDCVGNLYPQLQEFGERKTALPDQITVDDLTHKSCHPRARHIGAPDFLREPLDEILHADREPIVRRSDFGDLLRHIVVLHPGKPVDVQLRDVNDLPRFKMVESGFVGAGIPGTREPRRGFEHPAFTVLRIRKAEVRNRRERRLLKVSGALVAAGGVKILQRSGDTGFAVPLFALREHLAEFGFRFVGKAFVQRNDDAFGGLREGDVYLVF